MIWIKIKAYESGLVFKNGELKSVLKRGVYFPGMGSSVKIFKTTEEFIPPVEWAILEKNQKLMEMLEVVDVAENELVLMYKDQRFFRVLTAGRYAFWKDVLNLRFDRYNFEETFVPVELGRNILKFPILKDYYFEYEVMPFEKAVLFANDQYEGILSGGIYYFWKNGKPVRIETADMRRQGVEINGQELLTADKAAVRINFNAVYQVADIEKALIENKNFDKQLYTEIQLALREFVGEFTLDELLSNKEKVSKRVENSVEKSVAGLGVKLLSAGIKDVILPGEVKEIMNKVLIAQKEAQANVITRREETASTRNLLNTAKLMEENEMLFRLKEMEYVEKIASKIGDISVSGNGGVITQLKEIFGTGT